METIIKKETRGRPKKVIIIDINEPIIKKTRGRPKKEIILIDEITVEQQNKRPVGRPRKIIIEKIKKPSGRPKKIETEKITYDLKEYHKNYYKNLKYKSMCSCCKLMLNECHNITN